MAKRGYSTEWTSFEQNLLEEEEVANRRFNTELIGSEMDNSDEAVRQRELNQFVIYDEETDEITSVIEDLVLDIDSIFEFELDDDFTIFKYDWYMWFITFILISLNGFIIISFLYFTLGVHYFCETSEDPSAKDLEEIEKELLIMQQFNAFVHKKQALTATNANILHRKRRFLTDMELDLLRNRLFYNYDAYKIKNYTLSFKKRELEKYEIFIKNYYDLIIFNILKKNNFILNNKIYNLKKSYKKELLDIKKQEVRIISTTLKLSDTTLRILNKKIILSYKFRDLNYNDNIKVCYLIF